MSGLTTIGKALTNVVGYAIDRPRWAVVLVPSTAGAAPQLLTTVENFETEKDDTGNAGTFHFEMPLAANQEVATFISPMDLIAIYAARNSTTYGAQAGSQQGIPVSGSFQSIQPPDLSDLAWSSSNATTTWQLGYPTSCLMIGMIDGHDESMDEESGVATMTVWGRDLTKIFIENDLAIPQMNVGSTSFLQTAQLTINKAESGTQLLNNILDAFCAKNPAAIAAITGGTITGLIQDFAQYGFPWRNFVRTDALVPGFETFAPGVQPNYATASGGSTWLNCQSLKNEPLYRLFVNEIGQLIFDSAFPAWGFTPVDGSSTTPQAPGAVITQDQMRKRKWERDDSGLKTCMSILLAQAVGGTSTVLQGMQIAAIRNNLPSLIQQFGFRYFEFTSLFDPITTDASYLNATRLPVLLADANDLWRGEITVKGDPIYRVGMRVLLKGIRTAHPDLGLMNTPQGMGWYVTKVTHRAGWGSDYSTDLSLRFSSASLQTAAPTTTVSGNPTSVT